MYIYKIRRRRPGTLKEHLQRAHYPWLQPFFAVEWIWDWLAYLLGNWSFLEVLEYLGTFSILLGVILFFAESGGRKEALQELVADGVDLVGVDVSDAFLMGVRLPSANLARANLRATDLRM